MKYTEYEEQCKVVEYLRKVHPDVLFTASIAGHVKMTIPQWKRAVKAGYTKGTPDLMIFHDRHDGRRAVLFVEMKSPKGKASESQMKFLNSIRSDYLDAYVCQSSETAIRCIEYYLTGVKF